ncbi:MAG: 16S rRNA (guanine(527)-N(7))-methyltransferase RsmG [Thermodesulfobacteriota bacterium]
MTWDPDEWKGLLEKAAAEGDIPLTALQLTQCSVHAELLWRWNQKTNLTSITRPREMVIKHFIDSMLPGKRLNPGERLIDIGSGGGFPGLPLKIAHPSLSVTMIDAVRKKVSFLNEVIRTLGLTGIRALHGRVEELGKTMGPDDRYDVAISRAFSSLRLFIPLALPLLKPGGRILAMKAKTIDEEVRELATLRMTLPDGREICGKELHLESWSYALPAAGGKRVLLGIIFP